MVDENEIQDTLQKASPVPYEPPRVELVLTQEDLQRDNIFAGISVT